MRFVFPLARSIAKYTLLKNVITMPTNSIAKYWLPTAIKSAGVFANFKILWLNGTMHNKTAPKSAHIDTKLLTRFFTNS